MSTENNNQSDSSQKNDTSKNNQKNDIYSIYEKNMQKYFENIRKNTPQYFQVITDFQQECIKTVEKTLHVMINTQQEFLNKSGMDINISQDVKNSLINASKQMTQANDVSKDMAKTILEGAVENLKTFSENVSSFADMNKNILKSSTQ